MGSIRFRECVELKSFNSLGEGAGEGLDGCFVGPERSASSKCAGREDTADDVIAIGAVTAVEGPEEPGR